LANNRIKPRFIGIEGPHGAGKTTLARSVVRALMKDKVKAVYTKEPFSKDLRELIRKFSTSHNVNPTALALLVAADRSLHISRIERWLRGGAIVLSDRYSLSSYVYQRIDGVNKKFVDILNREFYPPDLTILLMVPLRLRLERLKKELRSRPFDRFLTQTAFRAEQRLYSHIARSGAPRLQVFDGSRPMEDLVRDARTAISGLNRGSSYRKESSTIKCV
jgi:dTMP kinase